MWQHGNLMVGKPIHASWNWVIVGSGYGVSHFRRQAVTSTNADALPFGTSDIALVVLIRNPFSPKNMLLKCCLHKAAMLSQPECVSGMFRWDSNTVRCVIIGSDSTVSLNTPHSSPGSQLHCVIFVGSLFVHFVACQLGMAAGGPLWCCCPGAFGRGHASMALGSVTTDWLVSVGVRSGQRWDGAPLQ